jgi:hypothetical protein
VIWQLSAKALEALAKHGPDGVETYCSRIQQLSEIYPDLFCIGVLMAGISLADMQATRI